MLSIKTTLYTPTQPGIPLLQEHEFDPATTHYMARFMGGGGAGEGAKSGAGSRVSAGSPGGSAAEGRFPEPLPAPPSRKIWVHAGYGGVGQAIDDPSRANGANAMDGDASQVQDDLNGTWTASGGSGGQHETNEKPPYVSANANGRAGVATDPAGRVIGAGRPGGMAMIFNISGAMMAYADGGAPSARGRGFEAVRITASAARQGRDAEGPGAGGGGSVSIDAGSVRGGHGGPGEVEITEYQIA
jgi:hypothetical protein